MGGSRRIAPQFVTPAIKRMPRTPIRGGNLGEGRPARPCHIESLWAVPPQHTVLVRSQFANAQDKLRSNLNSYCWPSCSWQDSDRSPHGFIIREPRFGQGRAQLAPSGVLIECRCRCRGDSRIALGGESKTPGRPHIASCRIAPTKANTQNQFPVIYDSDFCRLS